MRLLIKVSFRKITLFFVTYLSPNLGRHGLGVRVTSWGMSMYVTSGRTEAHRFHSQGVPAAQNKLHGHWCNFYFLLWLSAQFPWWFNEVYGTCSTLYMVLAVGGNGKVCWIHRFMKCSTKTAQGVISSSSATKQCHNLCNEYGWHLRIYANYQTWRCSMA